MRATATESEISRFRLRKGDVIVTKDSESWDDIAVPAYVDMELQDVLCGYHLALIRAKQDATDSRYLFRCFAAKEINDQFQVAATGITRYGLGQYWLENALFPVPPLREQRAIADFLDRKTAEIDALVAKFERLIELLEERRAALISHAVTKGLDPDAPMKDSGIEWLGEIPAHWEVIPLKRISSIRYGLGQPPAEAASGLPLVRATNVKHGRISRRGMMYVDPDDVPSSREAELKAGEIIVVRSGAYTGDSAMIPPEYEGAIAGYDMIVTVRRGNSRFVAWQLLCPDVSELQFGFHKLRAAQPHLNAEELGQTWITWPTTAEQIAIADYLDSQTAAIDRLFDETTEAANRVREYRTALISAAVTGKIDVRGATGGAH